MRLYSPTTIQVTGGLSDYFVVTSSPYSATGDGTTDDTSSINSAITAANAAGGGIVYVPEGTYVVTGVILKSNVVLRGSGYNSVLKLKDTTTNDVILGPGSEIVRSGVEYVRIDGNKANQDHTLANTAAEQYGIALYGADCWIDRVWIHDTVRSGIYVIGPRWDIGYTEVKNGGYASSHVSDVGNEIIGRSGIVCGDGVATTSSHIHHCRVDTVLEHGIKLYDGTTDSGVTHCVVNGAGDRGIYIEGGDSVTVDANRVYSCSVVGIFVGAAGHAGLNPSVTGNTVRATTGHGILLTAQTGGSVSGNTVTGSSTNGIYVVDSSAVAVSGNSSRSNTASGIVLYQSTDCTISGNVCNSNVNGIWTWDGGTACLDVAITGNRCKSNSNYGILTENLSNYTTLGGNVLRGNTGGTYSLVGANNSVLAAPHTTATYGPFYINRDLTASTTPVMSIGYFNAATTVFQDSANVIKMRSAGKVVGLLAVTSVDRTAGSITFYVKINGASGVPISGNSVTIDGTNVASHSALVAHDSGISFAAGDTLQIEADVSSGYTVLATDLTAWLTVSLD